MSTKTSGEFDGLCRRCGLRPKRIRSRNLLLLGLFLVVSLLWWSTNAEIRTAEESGGSFFSHSLLIVVYESTGRFGVNIAFMTAWTAVTSVFIASVVGGNNEKRALRDSLHQNTDFQR